MEIESFVQDIKQEDPLEIDSQDQIFENREVIKTEDADEISSVSDVNRKATSFGNCEDKITCHVCNETLSDESMVRDHLTTTHNFLQCKVCPKLSTSINALRNHMRDKHPIKCEYCKESFRTVKLLAQHCSEKHSSEKQNCHLCKEVLGSKPLLDSHLVTVHNFFQCEACSSIYPKKASLSDHIRRRHPLKCEYCGKDFRSNQALEKHCLEQHVAQEKKCSLCSEVLANQQKLEDHLVQVHKFLQCEICGKLYSKKNSYTAHVHRMHPLERESTDKKSTVKQEPEPATQNKKCNLCEVVLENQTFLDDHLVEIHNYVRCKICAKVYTSTNSLRSHLAFIHPLKCEHCEEVFETKLKLDNHYSEKHQSQERKCEVCNEILKNQALFVTHMSEIHSFVQCKICFKLYANQKTVASHILRLHPAKCEHCGDIIAPRKRRSHRCGDASESGGSNQYDLKAEMVKLQKTFQCEICSNTYPRKSALLYHKRKTHPITCEHCNEIFTSKRQLRQHGMEKHATQWRRCELCSDVLDNQTMLDAHLVQVHGFFQCELCPRLYPKKGSFYEHTRRRHPLFKCECCESRFTSQGLLNQHRSQQHDIHTRQCHLCSETLDNQTLLNTHLTEAHQYFQCYICSKVYPEKMVLRRHIFKNHHLRCKYCNRILKSQPKLMEHLAKEHSAEISKKPKLSLEEYEESSSGESDEDNMTVDSIEIGKFDCDECDAVFEDFQELEYHQKEHIPRSETQEIHQVSVVKFEITEVKIEASEELFHCSICGKVFELCDDLEKHSKIHVKLETN